MFIRSERLFLRPGWPEDWDELLAGIGDEAVVRNLAKAPWPYTAEHARDFAAKAQDAQLPHFLVTLPSAASPGRVIGGIGFGAKPDDAIELGYWFARPFWGQGYATEAGRAVLRLARTLGHRQVRAGHFVDNPASGRVLRKLGFVPTGEVRQRFSCARGVDVPSIEHRLVLGELSDCDGCDTDAVAMRAA